MDEVSVTRVHGPWVTETSAGADRREYLEHSSDRSHLQRPQERGPPPARTPGLTQEMQVQTRYLEGAGPGEATRRESAMETRVLRNIHSGVRRGRRDGKDRSCRGKQAAQRPSRFKEVETDDGQGYGP